jgi:hypothetical protein
MQRNPKAFVRLRGRKFDFSCFLGNGRAKITGGGAEYEALKRPNDDAATLFTGNGLLTIDVPVLFDGWGPPGRRSDVGPHIDQVYALCFGEGRLPPPDFIASGPIPGSGKRFQMALPEELEDPRPITGESGTRFRLALVLKLVEFNDPGEVKWQSAPGSGHVGKMAIAQGVPTSIVLAQSETLLQVAAKVYGDPGAASDIGELNGIADLRKKLKAGTRLKLPATVTNLTAGIEV